MSVGVLDCVRTFEELKEQAAALRGEILSDNKLTDNVRERNNRISELFRENFEEYTQHVESYKNDPDFANLVSKTEKAKDEVTQLVSAVIMWYSNIFDEIKDESSRLNEEIRSDEFKVTDARREKSESIEASFTEVIVNYTKDLKTFKYNPNLQNSFEKACSAKDELESLDLTVRMNLILQSSGV
ncbi:MAG: hypothetical protein K940chlam1_01301 [Candidatus Anoxychlamydiales bacterium]|nr:hypothetical protein [Candidatus Anoxychlamydiales bacterium]NGX36557.1 hypothetical protein [Candidatus Anoxychlamydiales bacterium]